MAAIFKNEAEESETDEATLSADEPQAENPAGPAFGFAQGARAIRFIWKIDALGRFTAVSHEFIEAVGARAVNVEGILFADVAARFHLDSHGKIAVLLGRRDTWLGRKIYWPVNYSAKENTFCPAELK